MLAALFRTISDHAKQWTTAAAIIGISAIVVLTQFGSLSRQVIDHDESTFILMGADVAAGHLPFAQSFDLKPPVMFFMLGAVIATFGKSLLAIRLIGDLLLVLTALLTFSIARRFVGQSAALGGALIYVAVASLDLGQGTVTELPATAFLMGALWLLTRTTVSLPTAAGAGLLVSLAVLTRSNLALVAMAIGILLVIANLRRSEVIARGAWLSYVLAGLLLPAFLVLTYAASGELATLKLAMIDVPLAYSGQMTMPEAMARHAGLFVDRVKDEAPAILLPAAALAVMGLIVLARRLALDKSVILTWGEILTCAFAGSVVLSIACSGAAYDHYWLQVLPFLGLLAALALDVGLRRHRATALATLALIGLPLGSSLAAEAPATIALAMGALTTGASYDQDYDVTAAAHHIAASGLTRPRIWCWSKHLIHWYLDAPLLSRAAAHPDNLGRRAIIDPLSAAGYVSRDEIGRMMNDLPDYIVTDEGEVGLRWARKTGKPVDQWLADHYYLEAFFGDVLVYRRIT